MVLLHVKRGDETLFFFEAPTSTSNNNLSATIADLHNTRLRIARLCMGAAARIVPTATCC